MLAGLGMLAGFAVLAGLGGLPRGAARASGAQRVAPRDYVSLGDSYAIGYQPSPSPGPTPGYTALVARRTGMVLVNFGCSGATTTSILETKGCAPPKGLPAAQGVARYPHETQAAAAEAFIRRHRDRIGLITVSIGGNDITHCAVAPDPISCVLAAVALVRAHVAALARGLRRAAGPTVPIIGLSYPDVILASWIYPPGHPNRELAALSVTAFKLLFNPALARAYRAGRASFVDVTKDTGAYLPLTKTTSLTPYGTIPVAVANVCRLTWACAQGNIHANSAGYARIGREILARYRALTRR